MSTDKCENDRIAAGQLLDTLYLDMFHLIEAHTQCRTDIERTYSSGAILLARTKFQQGGQSISTAQIPTENSAEFKALCRVINAPDEDRAAGIIIERYAVDKENGYVEPLHWFSVLPPINLRNAVERFKKAIELVAESTNLQRELSTVLSGINRLRQIVALR